MGAFRPTFFPIENPQGNCVFQKIQPYPGRDLNPGLWGLEHIAFNSILINKFSQKLFQTQYILTFNQYLFQARLKHMAITQSRNNKKQVSEHIAFFATFLSIHPHYTGIHMWVCTVQSKWE